jgi:formate hydrogenlyase subunit 6/NADH:ubiquinone oxidoreductase subunit I
MLLICRDCHEAVHALFSNKQLEHEYNTVDVLLNNSKLLKTIKFISKQDPSRRTKTKLSGDQRKRRRNG